MAAHAPDRPGQIADQEVSEDQPAALKMLAVDDDVLVLMNTVAMLEDLGHTVLLAFSGAAALKQMESQDVDLVITDHGTPGMTGLQFAQEIRQRSPSLPVVVATGHIDLDLPEDDPLRALSRLNKQFGARGAAPRHQSRGGTSVDSFTVPGRRNVRG